MNQPENQSDRATPEDVLLRVDEELRKAAAYYARQGWWDNEQDARESRRILSSLRAPVASELKPAAWRIEGEETDGEWGGVLAFDYITDDAGVAEESAADGHTVTPLYAAPPAPVVQQQPRAWEWSAECRDGKVWRGVTMDRDTAERWISQEDFIGTVTPLYALQESP